MVSDPTPVTIYVDTPPVAENQSVTVFPWGTTWINLWAWDSSDDDPAGANLTYQIVTPPQQGNLSANVAATEAAPT